MESKVTTTNMHSNSLPLATSFLFPSVLRKILTECLKKCMLLPTISCVAYAYAYELWLLAHLVLSTKHTEL